MSSKAETCRPFLHGDFARAASRRRAWRARLGTVAVTVAATIVLLLLCAIPLYLLAGALTVPGAARSIDWMRLGVLFLGSLRASVVALTFAVPLGLATAMFSAHFCAPRLRAWLRPGLELLEALPTVVLGLVALATLAPWLSRHVGGVLAAFVAVPCALLAFGFAFSAPSRLRAWLPLWLLPIVLGAFALAIALAVHFDAARVAATSPWNALLVGLMLGVAVLPTVYSIAEEALGVASTAQTRAALALGATRWQAMTTIALPAALPGLSAAVLMAGGRCFGETMIVLMASGNTPLGGFDLLGGLRSLSVELALELPRSAPHGAVHRELLVAGLLLLATTMLFHFAAQALRTRLRARRAGA